MKKKILFIFLGILLLIICIIAINYIIEQKKEREEIANQEKIEKARQEKIADVEKHYGEFVITNKKTPLYDEQHKKIGNIDQGYELKLNDLKITYETEYFMIEGLNYSVKYQDVDKIEKPSDKDTRYKKYILFNENVITNDITNFYNNNGLILTINKSYNLPIVVKNNDKYYVELNNELYYVLKTNAEKVIENNNTSEISSTKMAVLNYHGFYDPNLGDTNCQTIICLTTQKFEEQLKYITDNNFLAVTMWEFEQYIDGNLRLPIKSVLLTIDDGGPNVTTRAIPLLEKYNQMATLFLVTAWFEDLSVFESKNLELHSHGHNLHNQYECPGYGEQGGAIMCKDRQYLLDDLATSRKLLNNTTAFAYPFYDFNEYSISVLKEAGFTLGFRGGYIKANIGVDKFRVPRLTIFSDLTLEKFKSLIN